jgi:hypothetical protein
MKKGIKMACLAAFALLSGCKRSLKSNEYVSYIRDIQNGLNKIVTLDGWQYTVQYRPCEYILLQEHNSVKETGQRRKELAGTVSFVIKVKRADNSVSPLRYNLSSREEYDQRLDYFLNHAGKELKLVYGKDTLYPTAYEFENNYNLTPEETMLVGFTLPGREQVPGNDMQLSYNDQVFKNGIIKVKFNKEDLNNIPNLIE